MPLSKPGMQAGSSNVDGCSARGWLQRPGMHHTVAPPGLQLLVCHARPQPPCPGPAQTSNVAVLMWPMHVEHPPPCST